MFCSNCGKQLAGDSKFCNACGAATAVGNPASDNVGASIERCDSKVLSELKKYKNHSSEEVLCLECGYRGFMGISDRVISRAWFIKWLFYSIVAATFIISVVGAMPFLAVLGIPIFCFVCGLIWRSVRKRYWICPSCETLLKPINQE